MAQVSEEELRAVLHSIVRESALDEDILSSFAYEGFDHKATFAKLMTYESNKAAFIKDMSMLLQFVLIRGPNVQEAVKTMSQAGKERISALCMKYSLTRVASSKKDGPTLSRILALFPNLANNLLSNEAFYEKTAFSKIPDLTIVINGESYSSSKLPVGLRFPGSNCLLKDPMTPAYTAFMLSFSRVINRGKKAWEKLDSDEQIAEVVKWQQVTAVNPMQRIVSREARRSEADASVSSSIAAPSGPKK